MTFIAELKKHPTRLPLRRAKGIDVFCCLWPDSHCPSSRFGGGANAVVLRRAGEGFEVPEKPTVRLRSRHLRYVKAEEWQSDEEGELHDAAKVRGFPFWVQGNATPNCSRCAAPMRFVAQLPSSLDRRLIFGDGGTGYAFVCGKEHEGAFGWQGY